MIIGNRPVKSKLASQLFNFSISSILNQTFPYSGEKSNIGLVCPKGGAPTLGPLLPLAQPLVELELYPVTTIKSVSVLVYVLPLVVSSKVTS